MYKRFLEMFTNENFKNMAISNYKEFTIQELDFKPIKKDINNQIKILEALKKDILKDEDNIYKDELIKKIEDKIEVIRL